MDLHNGIIGFSEESQSRLELGEETEMSSLQLIGYKAAKQVCLYLYRRHNMLCVYIVFNLHL